MKSGYPTRMPSSLHRATRRRPQVSLYLCLWTGTSQVVQKLNRVSFSLWSCLSCVLCGALSHQRSQCWRGPWPTTTVGLLWIKLMMVDFVTGSSLQSDTNIRIAVARRWVLIKKICQWVTRVVMIQTRQAQAKKGVAVPASVLPNTGLLSDAAHQAQSQSCGMQLRVERKLQAIFTTMEADLWCSLRLLFATLSSTRWHLASPRSELP